MEQARDWPTDEDVAFFRDHGYWVTPRFLPDELLDDAAHGAERHWAGECDWPLPLSGGYLDWQREHGEALRLNDYVSLQNAAIRRLVIYPPLARIREHLQQQLPAHMVPAANAIVRLDALPMTATGKVDRKRLPQPDRQRAAGLLRARGYDVRVEQDRLHAGTVVKFVYAT